MTPEAQALYVAVLRWRMSERDLDAAIKAGRHKAIISMHRRFARENLQNLRNTANADPYLTPLHDFLSSK
jgi:hypothetical protein